MLFLPLKHFLAWLKAIFIVLTKPSPSPSAFGILTDIARSCADLIAENTLLRHQLILLNRQVKRPKLTFRDHLRLILLARLSKYRQHALFIAQPETLLRWHRDLFKRYWRQKPRSKKKPSRISSETIALIIQMANENKLWGAERIRGELLKLGIRISKRTIQKYLPKSPRSTGQTWAAFLKYHASDIWTCDSTVVYDLLFRPIFIFVIMEFKSRRIIHSAVARSPTDAWTTQQLREATPWGIRPKYLVRDHDRKYGPLFSALAASSEIKEIKTPYCAPKANAVCERFIGSLEHECLDHILIFNQRQLRRSIREYLDYYNHSRPHQGIDQHIPGNFSLRNPRPASGKVISKPVLGGLHHDYSRIAYLH